jgi:hypothetical protein
MEQEWFNIIVDMI